MLCQQTHNVMRMGFVLRYLGIYAANLGKWQECNSYLDQSLSVFQSVGSHSGLHEAYYDKSVLRLIDGDFSSAIEYAHKSLFHARAINYPGQTTDSLQLVAEISLVQSRYANAIRFTREAIQTMVDADAPLIRCEFITPILEACGRYGLGENDAAAALVREHFVPWNTHYELLHFSVRLVIYHLLGLAYLLADAGEGERALELVSYAVNNPKTPDWWVEREPLTVKLLARLKGCLSPAQYTTAWERGKSLDLNTALAALLELPNP